MRKLFPFAGVVTLGSAGVAVTLCVCLQAQTSAQPAGRQQAAGPPPSSAATDAVTCFQADNAQTRALQFNRGRETSGTPADHNHIEMIHYFSNRTFDSAVNLR